MNEEEIAFYITNSRRLIDANGSLNKLENVAINFLRGGYTEVIVRGNGHARKYVKDEEKSKNNVEIPGTQERGKYLVLKVEELSVIGRCD